MASKASVFYEDEPQRAEVLGDEPVERGSISVSSCPTDFTFALVKSQDIFQGHIKLEHMRR